MSATLNGKKWTELRSRTIVTRLGVQPLTSFQQNCQMQCNFECDPNGKSSCDLRRHYLLGMFAETAETDRYRPTSQAEIEPSGRNGGTSQADGGPPQAVRPLQSADGPSYRHKALSECYQGP